MASKKDLKQSINYVTCELFFECLFCKLYIPGVDQEKADQVLTDILNMQDNFLRRTNNYDGKEDRKIVRSYFKKLNDDLQKAINDIADKIQGLN